MKKLNSLLFATACVAVLQVACTKDSPSSSTPSAPIDPVNLELAFVADHEGGQKLVADDGTVTDYTPDAQTLGPDQMGPPAPVTKPNGKLLPNKLVIENPNNDYSDPKQVEAASLRFDMMKTVEARSKEKFNAVKVGNVVEESYSSWNSNGNVYSKFSSGKVTSKSESVLERETAATVKISNQLLNDTFEVAEKDSCALKTEKSSFEYVQCASGESEDPVLNAIVQKYGVERTQQIIQQQEVIGQNCWLKSSKDTKKTLEFGVVKLVSGQSFRALKVTTISSGQMVCQANGSDTETDGGQGSRKLIEFRPLDVLPLVDGLNLGTLDVEYNSGGGVVSANASEIRRISQPNN